MASPKSEGRAKDRADGRRPLLIYLQPELIRDLKRKALDADTHVYLLIEELLLQQQGRKD